MNLALLIAYLLSYLSIIPIYLIYNIKVIYVLPVLIFISLVSFRSKLYRFIMSIALGIALFIIYTIFIGTSYGLFAVPIAILSLHGGIRTLNVNYPYRFMFYGLGPTSLTILFASIMFLSWGFVDINVIFLSLAYITYLILMIFIIRKALKNTVINIPTEINVIRDEQNEYTYRIVNHSKLAVRVSIKGEKNIPFNMRVSPETAEITPRSLISGKLTVLGLKIGKYLGELSIFIYDTKGLYIYKDHIHLSVVIKPKLTLAIERARRLISELGLGPEVSEEVAMVTVYGPHRSDVTGEFSGCREYIPGDDPKSIYNKKSVEKHKLIVKEYEKLGVAPTLLFIDVGVGTPEDLDEVLYNALQILMFLIINGRLNAGMIIYDDKDFIIKFPYVSPIFLLKKFLVMIDKFSPINKIYHFDLDDVPITTIISSKTTLAKAHIKFLNYRFMRSILHNSLVWINDVLRRYSEIYVVRSSSRYMPFYPLLKLYGEKMGHRVNIVDKQFLEKITRA